MQDGEAIFPRNTVKLESSVGLANHNYGLDFTSREAEAMNKPRPGMPGRVLL